MHQRGVAIAVLGLQRGGDGGVDIGHAHDGTKGIICSSCTKA